MDLCTIRNSIVLTLFIGVGSACGGQSEPASETMSQPPAAEQGGENTVPEGEHTMPDGTTMEGHSHPEQGQHTMPDGTTMEGHEHTHPD